MAKDETRCSYTFVNPNTPNAFEQLLKQLLIEKIRSLHTGQTDQSHQKGAACI